MREHILDRADARIQKDDLRAVLAPEEQPGFGLESSLVSNSLIWALPELQDGGGKRDRSL